jgi:hypothetical protein
VLFGRLSLTLEPILLCTILSGTVYSDFCQIITHIISCYSSNTNLIDILSGTMEVPALSGSWSAPFFGLLAEVAGSARSDSSESSSSASSESSHEFIVDDNYMIVANAEVSLDEMSDIVDSVMSVQSSGSRSKSPVAASQRKLQPNLDAITEAVLIKEDEGDPCEAYLRAKMASLWTRIQETAKKEDPSDTPCTEEDAALLRAYQRKNDMLGFLDQTSKIFGGWF